MTFIADKMASPPRYRAFLSYSHADAAEANWLHRALEAYHVPAKLVGMATPSGPVPRRLAPIFRDREELPASGDLSSQLREALATAQFLLVIASPASALSRWVNEEVRSFKAQHGEARVLVVIAAGEPNASDHPGGAAAECFCPALRFHVSADGAITDDPAAPVAADLRAQGDGRRLAKLKLVAGLTGVRLDDLIRREAQRRHRRMSWLAIAASGLAVVMAGLAITAVRARHEAERQRAEADGLVEFMLTDLRRKLEPVGRLDVLDVVGQRALAYYGDQDPASLDADALGRRARALHLVGEVRNTRGDSEGALAAFHQALATTSELLARDPHNGQRIFDQAQSVYWVGYVAWQRGQAGEAERAFRAYKTYADDLVAIDPHNGDWQMEVSYADSNLGTLLMDQARYAEAARAFAEALRIGEAAAARKPGDTDAQIAVGQDLSWLASAEARLNRTGDALALLHRELAIYARVLKTDPGNMTAKSQSVTALQTIGAREIDLGHIAASIASYQSAETLSDRVIAAEPMNSQWREVSYITHNGLAKDFFFAGNRQASWREYGEADRSLGDLVRLDPKNVAWNVLSRSELAMLKGSLLQSMGQCATALPLFIRASAEMHQSMSSKNADVLIPLGWSEQRAGDCAQQLGQSAQARADWQSAAADMQGPDDTLNSTELAIRFAVSTRLGQSDHAARIAAVLDRRGYRHPYYVQERARTRTDRPRPGA